MLLFNSYICTLFRYTNVKLCVIYMYDYDCFIHKYLCKKDEKKKYEHEYRYKNAFILFTFKKKLNNTGWFHYQYKLQ